MDKNLLFEVLSAAGLAYGEVVKPGRKNSPQILAGELIEAILETSSGPEAAKCLGISAQTFNRIIKKTFPEVELIGGGQTWRHWLLKNAEYKSCSCCQKLLKFSEFTKDTHSPTGLDKYCKPCKVFSTDKEYYKKYYNKNKEDYRFRSAKRRAIKKNATPKWANLESIKEIYRNCPEGYHVDHIIPLQGELVCGLHVENNLQYLTATENLSKGNKFIPGLEK